MPRWTPLPTHLRTLAATSLNAVLLETSLFDDQNHHSYLFLNPTGIITAQTLEELPAFFRKLQQAHAAGMHLAGYLNYECGYHFEQSRFEPLNKQSSTNEPIAWFGAYAKPFIFDHATGAFLGPMPPEAPTEPTPAAFASEASLDLPQPDYEEKIRRIKRYIEAGDTYQVNFTDSVTVAAPHSAAASFAALSAAQPVAYSALLHLAGRDGHDAQHILSLSPELFFRIENSPEGSRITTRPMKGTMHRGLDLAEDDAQSARLQSDEKNRSEHIMIVDLLRNDIGRICRPGSIRVEDLFSIERYRTLLQMTSTVSGHLLPGLSFYEIFRALFPSGSITGAPKLRTMQIIRELERNPRGVYTGTIGHIAPSGDATFNVAIRTLVLRNHTAHMGVGGGIVADSDPASEYRECQLKASFLTRTNPNFQLIETMLFDGAAMPYLSRHLDRLSASAQYFDFAFDRAAIESRITALATSLPRERQSIRLLLDSTGAITLTHAPLPADSPTIAVCISPHRTRASNYFLRHKTTRRELYSSELARARSEGFDEVLFLNRHGELTEGAISNLFVRIDGALLTPPLAAGVLPGVLRAHILATDPTAGERTLALADLARAEAIYLGNSVRGLRQVTRLQATETPGAPSSSRGG